MARLVFLSILLVTGAGPGQSSPCVCHDSTSAWRSRSGHRAGPAVPALSRIGSSRQFMTGSLSHGCACALLHELQFLTPLFLPPSSLRSQPLPCSKATRNLARWD